MKKILIIKMTSMGDVIHTLPALTDAANSFKGISFDWVVEEGFAQIPHWHNKVDRIIPVALRRWRRNIFNTLLNTEWWDFVRQLRENYYDAIIDAQGLLKSAMITRLSRGMRCGLDKLSSRERLANFAYQHKFNINPKQHAIKRNRELFAKALNYTPNFEVLDYGIDQARLGHYDLPERYVVFIHGTTWESKLWPKAYWHVLASKVAEMGYHVVLPWGNDTEKQRAEEIAYAVSSAIVLPKLNLSEIAGVLAQAKAVVAVDTGLGHLTAALGTPCISLYGPTDPMQVGTQGYHQQHIVMPCVCAPYRRRVCTQNVNESACLGRLTPEGVFQKLINFSALASLQEAQSVSLSPIPIGDSKPDKDVISNKVDE